MFSLPKVALLLGSLALAGQASAHGGDGGPFVLGAVVGAVVGGAVVASQRAPVYVEAPPPPPVAYYPPPQAVYAQPVYAQPVYYQPVVVQAPRYYGPRYYAPPPRAVYYDPRGHGHRGRW